jgi:hypothetical protein
MTPNPRTVEPENSARYENSQQVLIPVSSPVFRGILVVLLITCMVPPVGGASKDNSSPDDTGIESKLFPFNPYAQFIALQIQLKMAKKTLDWPKLLNDHHRGGFEIAAYTEPNAVLPMLTGIRIADGFVSVMAQNTDDLRQIAEEVESLALAQGINRKDIKGAEGVRKAALKGDWSGIITELAFLQAEIMEQYNGGDGRPLGPEEPKAILAVMAAFLQACTYATDIVSSNQPDLDLSNYLRVGRYLERLVAREKRLPESMIKNQRVQKCLQAMKNIQQLLDIPVDGTLSKEKVEQVSKEATEAVAAIIAP